MVLHSTPPARGGVVASASPLLIFDADCGFCTASARWIAARLPSHVQVVGWQYVDLVAVDLSVDDVRSAAYWIDQKGRAHRGHLAVARALTATSGIWRLIGLLLLLPPLRWLAAIGYRLVTRLRHRLPGSTAACEVNARPPSMTPQPPDDRATTVP